LTRAGSRGNEPGRALHNGAGLAYFENAHNALLAVPLNVGLGSPSPLSVTVHANNVSRQCDYAHVDFGVPHRITVNAAQDNGLEAERHRKRRPAARIQLDHLAVRGQRPGQSPVRRGVCDQYAVEPGNRRSCRKRVGSRAHVYVSELVVPEDPPAQIAAPGNLAVMVPFLVSLLVLYWVYRRIRRDGRP